MRIEHLGLDSRHLERVKELGRAHSATLGFFPEGAFDDHARKGTIIVASNDEGICVAYLLYRITNRIARITHLCVDHDARGQGVARLLADELKEATADLVGISLRCRRDYAANAMWPNLGFYAQAEIPGRGRDPKDLVCWWYSHGHPTLFDAAIAQENGTVISAALDANVFYDFFDDTRHGYQESIALRADWLGDSIQLVLGNEIFNEINRCEDRTLRTINRNRAAEFSTFQYSDADVEKLVRLIEDLHPKDAGKLSVADRSDIKQIACAVAGSLPVFVTRDERLLKKRFREAIHKRFNLQILRPADLIVQIDELRSDHEYEPARLAGTDLKLVLVKSGQEDSIIKLFCQTEPRPEFQTRFRGYLSDVENYRCSVVMTNAHEKLALIVTKLDEAERTKIPIFRVAPGPLAPTLARHLVVNITHASIANGAQAIEITDAFLSPHIATALGEEQFTRSKQNFMRFHLPRVSTKTAAVPSINSLTCRSDEERKYLETLEEILLQQPYEIALQTYADIEKALFPLKLIDSPVKTYMVPIRPEFAQELFDSDLAEQGLFPSRQDLALRKEQVYYRSRLNHAGIKRPARILWYVSQGKAVRHKSGAIRACSSLLEVNVDGPKALYARYKRLGIYEWKDVLRAAKGDVNNDIMALRFGDTELFQNQITVDELRLICKRHDFGLQLQSISRMPHSAFSEIYSKGMNRRSDDEE